MGTSRKMASTLASAALVVAGVASHASLRAQDIADEAVESRPEDRGGLDPYGESVRDEERADRPFAPARGLEPGPGVEVETDLVTMHAEEERARVYDAMREEAVREAAIAAAREEAPFDLSWGLDV